jgi:hypothetical protein
MHAIRMIDFLVSLSSSVFPRQSFLVSLSSSVFPHLGIEGIAQTLAEKV